MTASALGDAMARILVRGRLFFFLAFCLVAAWAAWSARRLTFDFSYRSWFEKDDPHLVEYDRFLETFGNDTPLIVVFSDPAGILDNRALGAVRRLSEEMARISHVESVLSLTNHRSIRASGGDLVVEPLVPELPLPAPRLAALRGVAADDARVRSLLLSPDGQTTQVIALLGKDGAAQPLQLRTELEAMTERLERETGYRFHVAGDPVVEAEFIRYALRDGMTILPAFALLVVLWLVAIYRTTLGVAVPLLVSNASVVITLGIAAAMGIRLGMLTTIVPQIVFAYGLSDGIHVYSNYAIRRNAGDDADAALHRAVRLTLLPCFLSSLTTAIGFASLGVSGIQPIRDTGLLCAIGVAVEYVVAFATFPLLARFARKIPATRSERAGLWHAVGRWSARRPVLIVALGAGLVLLGGAGMTRLRVNSDVIGQFKPSTAIRQDIEYINSHVSGAGDYELLIDTGRADGLLEPSALEQMDRLETYLHGIGELTHVISVLDLLKEANRALHGGDPAWLEPPSSRQAVAEMLFLLDMARGDGESLERLLSFDRSKARISARVPHLDTRRGLALIGQIRAWTKREVPELHVTMTGKTVTFTHAQEKISRTFIDSISVSIALVVTVILLAFRSLRLALVSVLPSIAPIAVAMGLMGVAAIALDFGTATVAAIALGITVDDTIHIFTRFRLHGMDVRRLPGIIRQTGFALCWSSLLLVAGFSVLVFSSFRGNATAGALLALMLALGLAFDLLMTPALLQLLFRRRARAVVRGGGAP